MAPTYTEKLSQQLAFIGQLNPASVGASTVLTASIDMAKYRRVLFVIQCGVLGASATIDAKVQPSRPPRQSPSWSRPRTITASC